MTSSVWALLCFIGILASGALGAREFGSDNRKIHSIRPSIPRLSPQVPPRVYERFEDIKSIEQTSDEAPSAETFQEVQLGGYTPRGFQQQGARPGANNYLTQERRRGDSGGWFVDVMCPVC